jgi:hypothetical protein
MKLDYGEISQNRIFSNLMWQGEQFALSHQDMIGAYPAVHKSLPSAHLPHSQSKTNCQKVTAILEVYSKYIHKR